VKKISILTFLLLILLSSIACAEFYKVNITRIDQDLYKDTNTGYYIKTRNCYEYVYYEDAIYNSDTQKLIFDNGSSYDVDKIIN